MISSSEINYISSLLPEIIPTDKVDNDKWVINNKFFGAELFTMNSDVILFIGARYGLEILFMAIKNKNCHIVIIENDKQKLVYIEQLIAKNNFLNNQVSVFSDFSNALVPDLLKNKTISARVSHEQLNLSVLDKLLENYNVEHICGEFSEHLCDPLAMYRLCETKAESFYWYVSGLKKPLVGQKSHFDYEVSVVVPAYNVGEYLDQCIESLALQSLESIEILVVDDGSPDDSGTRAELWADKYPGRVKVIHKINGGCASARNAGVQAARGKYIGFVDGDDWVSQRMYEDLYRSAVLATSDIAQCGFQEVYTEGEVVKFPLDVNLNRLDLLCERPTMWRRIYSATMLRAKNITFPEHIKRFDDLPFQFETFFNAKSVSNIPFCYYNYRQGRIGQDISVRDDRLYVHFPIFEWIYNRNSQNLNYNEELKLFQLELDVHYWAFSVIEEKYKKEYLSNTAGQIFDAKLNLSLTDMFSIARKKGMNRFMFFIRLFLTSKKKR